MTASWPRQSYSPLFMKPLRRTDHLMAQRVDVAIVFRDMLGLEDAAAYMARYDFPEHVVQRVLSGLAVTRIDGGELVEYAPSMPTDAGQ